MTNHFNIAWLLFAVVALASCKGGKDITGDKHIPNKRSAEVLALMQANELDCSWMSVKYEVEVESEKLEDSFKLYARLRKDSAIWISATYYAVEVGRFLFTPDSVKYMDRKNNQFYIGDYGYLVDQFNLDANFDILQSIIMGNSLPLKASVDNRIRSSKDGGAYLLSYLKKGQLKRAIKKEEEIKGVEMIVSLWVSPEDFRLAKTSLYDPSESRTLTASYSDFKETCNTSFPYTTDYLLTSPNEQAKVKTSVMKVTTDKKVSLSFTIPDKYESLTP